MAAVAAANTSAWDSDDWELVNDDGFVYKCKNRRPSDPSPLPRPTDSEAEEKYRRERKRRVLLKVRGKYEREIALWEHLSNTLTASERGAKQKKKQEQEVGQDFEQLIGAEQGYSSSSRNGLLVDKLLLQVEEQEAMIQHVTNLCDAAEALCDKQEDKAKGSFIDLPVWGSPRELMASLCYD
ncbi:hypothetical protein Ancab_026955 [Ancistrocladus abbreviatus]